MTHEVVIMIYSFAPRSKVSSFSSIVCSPSSTHRNGCKQRYYLIKPSNICFKTELLQKAKWPNYGQKIDTSCVRDWSRMSGQVLLSTFKKIYYLRDGRCDLTTIFPTNRTGTVWQSPIVLNFGGWMTVVLNSEATNSPSQSCIKIVQILNFSIRLLLNVYLFQLRYIMCKLHNANNVLNY